MTQDNLFSVPETPSPRLLWMQRHGITTSPPFVTSEAHRDHWLASGKLGLPFGEGDTEDDALVDYAKRHGLKLWNE